MHKLFDNYHQLIQAAEYCLSKHLTIPTLVLTYTAIDSVSWIASDNPKEGVRKRFERWADKWMLDDERLNCTASELYAARCGVLHTLTPNSDLSAKGVRKIAYAYGAAKINELEESMEHLALGDEIASIHVADLILSFKLGFANYLEESFKDENTIKNLSEKATQHFADLRMEKLDEFLVGARQNNA